MIDPTAMCPICMQPEAITNGICRYCRKRIPKDLPTGVLPPGVVLNGRYLTGLYLGVGGFGITYRAYDLIQNKAVAIKEYYPAACGWCSRNKGNPKLIIQEQDEYRCGLKHFKGESEILHNLSDIPEIVKCYDSFDENDTAYYTMELLDGQTLQEYLKASGKEISFLKTVELLMPLILGLAKMHERNSLHRDIKPSNIFLCSDGSLKILDLGASTAKGSQYADSFMPVVSEGYSPPEQCTVSHEKGRQGPWSDVYSVAGTIYRCVTGHRPPTSSERLAGDPLEFNTGKLSPQQRSVLERNLSLTPEARCSSMLAFADSLLSCLNSSESSGIRTKFPELKKQVPPEDNLPGVSNVLPEKDLDAKKLHEKKKPPVAKQAAALGVDMLLFQLAPYLISLLTGGDPILWLFAGYFLGVTICCLLTCSNFCGSPGETLFGLQVRNGNREKPNGKEALLYCMLRMLWPLKIADTVSFSVSKTTLTTQLSGCRSMLKSEAKRKRIALNITEGLYAGNIIPLHDGRYVLGRNPDSCNLIYPIAYNIVSRVQCVLVVDALDNVFITNKSSFGTKLDGRRLAPEESAQAKIGSRIAFGSETIIITYI